MINAVDEVNKGTMRAAVPVYTNFSGLGAPEQVALASIAERVEGGRILDLGVGGGRTVPHLVALSEHYIGVDYVRDMVDACAARYPGVRFEHADARYMPQFADASFDLIVFAWAGICMVDHPGRLQILKEIRRLLKPGGFFVFSTYNQNSADHHQSFEFPEFTFSLNPLKLTRRALGFARSTVARLRNRARLRRFEVRGDEYSIVNDRCHDYATLLYYIALPNQRRQLAQAGFVKPPAVYDGSGRPVETDTPDSSITFVVES